MLQKHLDIHGTKLGNLYFNLFLIVPIPCLVSHRTEWKITREIGPVSKSTRLSAAELHNFSFSKCLSTCSLLSHFFPSTPCFFKDEQFLAAVLLLIMFLLFAWLYLSLVFKISFTPHLIIHRVLSALPSSPQTNTNPSLHFLELFVVHHFRT